MHSSLVTQCFCYPPYFLPVCLLVNQPMQSIQSPLLLPLQRWCNSKKEDATIRTWAKIYHWKEIVLVLICIFEKLVVCKRTFILVHLGLLPLLLLVLSSQKLYVRAMKDRKEDDVLVRYTEFWWAECIVPGCIGFIFYFSCFWLDLLVL